MAYREEPGCVTLLIFGAVYPPRFLSIPLPPSQAVASRSLHSGIHDRTRSLSYLRHPLFICQIIPGIPGRGPGSGIVGQPDESRQVFAARKKTKRVLRRNHFDSNYNALPGPLPAVMASPGCNCGLLPVLNRREIFSSVHAGRSQCAPAPNGGRAGARRAIIT